ncbi:MAG TPA: hypothetical protein VIJ50_07990 [Solirubrobacteraceae bacterium]
MRSPLMLFAIALIGISLAGCGGASSAHRTTVAGATQLPGYMKADSDQDSDVGSPYDDPNNNNNALDVGRAAGAQERHAVTALLERYYTAAAAGNGRAACAMIVASLAGSVAEDYGHGSAGSPYLSAGTSCPEVMGLLFAHFHAQLSVELPKLRVARVRILAGGGALAILSFASMPEREISVGREGSAWKLQALLDGEVP